MELEKADLCAIGAGQGANGPVLTLRAGMCGACRQLHFPITAYGCPRCGAEPGRVAEQALDGRATLLSFATIHSRLSPLITPPCVVGEAEIAPGLIEEIMLAGEESQYADGMAVRAVGVEITRGDTAVLACRFEPAEDAP
ncbi:hypothetical protein LCL97_22245 [Seohaeicola saemankumensis]|nr:hypothetical protein [Seohaeicola saemankumensis]MCA0873562.1 hypothetical protein [Seohaeicola saemankumensis]